MQSDVIQRSASTLFQAIGGASRPDEGFGILVVAVGVIADGYREFFEIANTPRRDWFWVRSRKKFSTMLSHEALVGVKCMWKRGWRSNLGMFVGRVVIADQV
jgi:hypothetical protein